MKMEILNKVMAPTNESIGAQHWKTHRKRGRGRSRSGRASVPGTAAKRYSKKDTVIAATTGRAIHHRTVLRCSFFLWWLLFFFWQWFLFLQRSFFQQLHDESRQIEQRRPIVLCFRLKWQTKTNLSGRKKKNKKKKQNKSPAVVISFWPPLNRIISQVVPNAKPWTKFALSNLSGR